MNVTKKKNANKTDWRPSIPQANPVFAKPANFLNHFAATKKPCLLNSTYPAKPNYKYESPWIQRSTSGESAVSESIELTGGRNFNGINNRADSILPSSAKKSDSTSSPLLAGSNTSRQRSVLPGLQTPISYQSNRKSGEFVGGSSSSRAKEKKATPKSTSSGTTSTSDQARVIVAITEGRGNSRGEVGLAAIDVRHPCLVLCQLSDTLNYHSTISKLNILNPSVIIFPNTFVDNQNSSKLLKTIQAKFPNVNQTSLKRKYFNDEQGIGMIKSLHLPECSSIEFLVLRKYYTLAAAAALLKYVEYIENVTLASSSVPMEYQAVENMMLIDFETMHHLELILSQANLGVSHSLFGILNHCLTFGGQRRLRSAILQPSCVLKDLEGRFDSVNELVDKPDLLHNIQNALATVPDIESLLKICFISETRKPDDSSLALINYIILLKSTLDMLPSLYNILSRDAKSKFFEKVTKCLQDPRFEDISSEIDTMLCKDTKRVKGYAASQFQRCFAIKPDINGLLDVARYTYSELVSDFQSKVAELADDYEIPLKCQNTGAKGFHIQLNIKGQRNFKLDSLPKVFMQVQRSRNIVTMITEELIFINERIKQALQEIQIMTNVILQELFHKIRENSGCFYNLCDRIAELDLIVSLARVSSSSGYVRPTFGSKLVLKSSRHPILDVVKTSVPIPNDVNAANMNNFHIITGPNMGGKSIYIKQVALIQIMAQIGCYVPAVSAELKLMDHLFSRIGFEDSIECNASTFVLELREIQHILRSATKSSLVIIDEFGRGTSSEEGAAIAWAVSEVFIHSPIYVFFATHFLFVTELQEFYPNVSVWNLGAKVTSLEDSSRQRLEFTHKLEPGVLSLTNYGLKLAEMTALSNSLKETASEIAQSLTKEKTQKQDWYMTEEDRRDIQLDKICCQLMTLSSTKELELDKMEEIILESNILEVYSQQIISNNTDIEDSCKTDESENVDLHATFENQDTTCNDDDTEVSEDSRENDQPTLADTEFDQNEREFVDVPSPFAPHPLSIQEETRNHSNEDTKKESLDVPTQGSRASLCSRNHENALDAIRQYDSPDTTDNLINDYDGNDSTKNTNFESRGNRPPVKKTENLSFKIDETTETQSVGDVTEQFSYVDTTLNITNPQLLETSAQNHSFTQMHTASWNMFWENGLLKDQHQPISLRKEGSVQENQENLFFDQKEGRPELSNELDPSNRSLVEQISFSNQSIDGNRFQNNSLQSPQDERHRNDQGPPTQIQQRIDVGMESDQNIERLSSSPASSEDDSKSPVSWKTPANDSSVERKYSSNNAFFFRPKSKQNLNLADKLEHETILSKHPSLQSPDQNLKTRLIKSKQCKTGTAAKAADQNYGEVLSPSLTTPPTEYEPRCYLRGTRVDLLHSAATKPPIKEKCKTKYDSKAHSPLNETGAIIYASERIATYSNQNVSEQTNQTLTTNQSYTTDCEEESYYSDSSSPKVVKKFRRDRQDNEPISPVTSAYNGEHSKQAGYNCYDTFRSLSHPGTIQREMKKSSKQRQVLRQNNSANISTYDDIEDHGSRNLQAESPHFNQYINVWTPENNEKDLVRVNSNFLPARVLYDSPGSTHQRVENSTRVSEEKRALTTDQKFQGNISYLLPSPVHLDKYFVNKENITGSEAIMNSSRNGKTYESRSKTKNFPVQHQKHGHNGSSFFASSNPTIESGKTNRAPSAVVPRKFHSNTQNFVMLFGKPNEFNISHQPDTQSKFFTNDSNKYSVQQSEEEFALFGGNQRQPTEEAVPTNELFDYDPTFSRPVGSVLNRNQIYQKKRVTFQEQPEMMCEDSPRSINSFILSQESQLLLQNNSTSNMKN